MTDVPTADVVVCGCGVIGLTVARELQQRGCSVTVIAREPAPATTSAVAAAIWYPYLAEPRDAVLRWSAVTFRRLRALARDPATGVSMQPTVELLAAARDPWWSPAVDDLEVVPAAGLRGLPGLCDLAGGRTAAAAALLRTTVPVCDTRRYLPWLLAAFRRHGGRLVEREIDSFDAAFALAPRVVNCTGLGAARLCGDALVQPVRGQIALVDRGEVATAVIDDTGREPVYLVPRGDELVLGGTAGRGDPRTGPDDADTARILADCTARVPALAGRPVRAVKVGLRPWRAAVRLEAEPVGPGRRLVHAYGHGGAGFTLAWGCAAEAADLVLGG